jgi:hypothetical protein
MGCDIHLVLEKKWNDRWVGVTDFPYIPVQVYGGAPDYKVVRGYPHYDVRHRDYDLFARLAGVRGRGPEPLGIPDDASDLARMEIEGWDSDGHSHSYCSLQEFVQAKLACDAPEKMLVEDDPRTQDPYYHYFGVDKGDAR